MLKSTYVPSAAVLQPLPPGWTQHKAPTGHTYYYNAETKESTYKRPVAPPPPMNPMESYHQHQAVPQLKLSDPNVANAFMAQFAAPPPQQHHGGRGGFGGPGGRGGNQSRPSPQPVDKPRSKVAIPGHEPWVLVYTKYGRRFAYNSAKNASYWRIPEKLMPAIIELDKERIRRKALGKSAEGREESNETSPTGPPAGPEQPTHDYDSSEYEEVEVTDDEADEHDEDGNPHKRQRTEESSENQGPVEFTEADIAAQLAAMEADYGIDEGEEYYDDEPGGNDAGGLLSEHDARELFKDLLNDFNINPYSPWDKLIEEGKVFDDPRYTVLSTTRERKEVWEEWSRGKIQQLREMRAKESKKDPKIPYMALLQEKATPKLYWPEFKRKYKKEDAMKDTKLSDKDREKWYREHINRLKMPQSQLKADLKKLLESVPLSALNNATMVSHLPPQVLGDIRYISLDPQIRDPFVEAYIQGLAPPPAEDQKAQEEEDEATRKKREERKKREKALEERERAVAEEKRRQEKRLAFERARLREEERELERAMQVGKKGLQSQLGVVGGDKDMEMADVEGEAHDQE
ncbi:Pre-mRNA-splicing factor dre4 [Naviculisporaceae sp. PSN 640]